MTNYGGDTDTIPWREISDDIQWIIIEDVCTSITSYAFIACRALSKVEIPNSVTAITGEGAFERCNNLVNIAIPDSVIFIDGYLCIAIA